MQRYLPGDDHDDEWPQSQRNIHTAGPDMGLSGPPPYMPASETSAIDENNFSFSRISQRRATHPSSCTSHEHDLHSRTQEPIIPPPYQQEQDVNNSPLPTYTAADTALISVSIPESALSSPSSSLTTDSEAPPRRHSLAWLHKLKPNQPSTDRIVVMTRGDYHRYWARDKHGNYIGSEPESEGPRIWREKMAAGGANHVERKERGFLERVSDDVGLVTPVTGQMAFVPGMRLGFSG